LLYLLIYRLTPDLQIDFLQVKESKEKEKLERRLLEELLKMFMDSESFYYSLTYDLTNSVQRQSTGERDGRPLWQKVYPQGGAVMAPDQCLFAFCRKLKCP
jgi:hypothetical protein